VCGGEIAAFCKMRLANAQKGAEELLAKFLPISAKTFDFLIVFAHLGKNLTLTLCFGMMTLIRKGFL
jgi:hypothetical protein